MRNKRVYRRNIEKNKDFKIEKATTENIISGKLRYAKKEERISVIVSPAVKEFIDKQKDLGKIKSANALINNLLENFMLEKILENK